MLQLWLVANTILWPLSATLGGMTLGLNVVVLILVGIVWLGINWKIAIGSAELILAFFAYAIYSSIVVLAGPCRADFSKSILSIPILMFLFLLGLEVGRRANNRDWLKLQTTSQWILVVVYISFAIEKLVPALFPLHAGAQASGQLSGLFSEPSHVAFSLFPCVAILQVSACKKTRRKGILAHIGLLVFSRSSTLVVLTAAWIAYRHLVQRKIRQAVLVVLGTALLVALVSIINFDQFVLPTVTRATGVAASSETTNVSSLVYVQGWQDAWFNLQRTRGIGLGLNMMGHGTLPDVPARNVLSLLGLENLNAQDGSFLFAKIISETGVLGMALYVMIIWRWIRLEKSLRRHSENPVHSVAVAQTALIFCFIVSSILRGAGYFSGGLLLLVVALSGTSKWRRNSLAQSDSASYQ